MAQVTEVRVHAFTAGALKPSVAQRMAEAAAHEMRRVVRTRARGGGGGGGGDAPPPPIHEQATHEGVQTAEGTGGGLSVVVHTSTGCVLGACGLLAPLHNHGGSQVVRESKGLYSPWAGPSFVPGVRTLLDCAGAHALVEKGVQAEALAAQCAQELDEVLAAGACVDQWMQDQVRRASRLSRDTAPEPSVCGWCVHADVRAVVADIYRRPQLIIFMALARGKSSFKCCEPTLHTRTAMVVAEALTAARFTVVRPAVTGAAWTIECEGAGLTRATAAAAGSAPA